jgi:hypothetical protein
MIMRLGLMKRYRFLALCLLAFAGIGSAYAHGGSYRGSVGVYFGPTFGPAWGPAYYPRPYYPQPYYYSPPVVVLPAPQPQVYIEQAPAPVQLAPAPVEQQYWYYCAASKSYYPYVKECRAGWQKVLPRPEQ